MNDSKRNTFIHPSIESEILKDGLWSLDKDYAHLNFASRKNLHHDRARLVCEKYGMKISDILHTTPKFWQFHLGFAATRDSAAFPVLTIHWNLCMGTIARFLKGRSDLGPVLEDLEAFRVRGDFMLTEIDHGLDARNLETIATLLPDGTFDLHTPHLGAAKVMPPSTPIDAKRLAVVFARLVINGEDRGVKGFIVRISDAGRMHRGIRSRPLPRRPGARPVDHAITSFDHVRIGPGALLGTLDRDSSRSERASFLEEIWRVEFGTLALALSAIPTLKTSVHVAAKYSLSRMVAGGLRKAQVPIVSFSTQYRPILIGLAQVAAFEEFARFAVQEFTRAQDPRSRTGIADIFKASITHAHQRTIGELCERLGWRGLMDCSQISENLHAYQGVTIAEGDMLVLCIRLASELLQGKDYSVALATDSSCLLARHEHGIFNEMQALVASLPGTHRSEHFNSAILPRCRGLVISIGQRMAYEAALSAGVDSELLALFEISCVMDDLSWYVEHAGMTRAELFSLEEGILRALRPHLSELVDKLSAGD